MKLAFTTLACPQWSLDRIIEQAGQDGYDGVDFRGYQGHLELWELPEFSGKAAQTAKRLAKAGIEVAGMSSSALMFDPDAAAAARHLDEVRRYAALCDTFGSRIIRIFGGALKGAPRQQAIDQSLRSMEQLAKAAAGATLAVETHDDWIRTDMLADVMARWASPNVRILWDLHHPYRVAGEQPAATYASIGRYVGYTHVKDSLPTSDGQYVYTMPGEGSVPLAEMIHLLKSGGYDGYLTVEWEKQWHPELAGPEVALPAYANFLRQFV